MKKLLLSTLMLLASALTVSAATKLSATPSTEMGEYKENNTTYYVKNVTDGSYTTKFWKSSAQASGDYILLTLDNMCLIETVNTYFCSGDKPTGTAKIQISTDNMQWTDIATFTSQDIGSSDTNYLFSCVANSSKARYVRLYIESASGNNWLQVAEIEVYGDELLTTSTPVISLASGSNIRKEVNRIAVSGEAGAVIYYTTDGSNPTESSQTAENGVINVDASQANLQDRITVKVAAKVSDKELSNVASAEYIVYPYSYVPVNYTVTDGNGNAANVASVSTSRAIGYNLNYTRERNDVAHYLDIVDAETSGFRVKRGETFDLNFSWTNAYWTGFSMFMDKGTGSLEEIFYGRGSQQDIVADASRNEIKLHNDSLSSKSITISPDAEYGEYMLRARVTETHEIGVSSRDQKIIDIFYSVCPEITVMAANSAEGSVSVSADNQETVLTTDKLYLIPVGNQVTVMATPAEGYLFSKWVDGNDAEISTTASYTFEAPAGNLTVRAVFEPEHQDKDIISDTTEVEDASYAVVTLSLNDATHEEPVWEVGTHHTAAEELVLDVEADGSAPEIELGNGGTIEAATIKVVRNITADRWTLMSMPFNVNLDEVQVNNGLAAYGTNIRIMEYDGAKRASGSVDGYTVSGWTEKTTGTIAANTGFAVVVNPASGDSQTVTFSSTNFSMDANDKTISLNRHESIANVASDGKSTDADWNFCGNPMLQSATKGTGYSLYIYDGATDSYAEHSGAETPAYSPFAAWFVQSDDGFTSMSFSHTASAGSDTEANIDGRFAISINGGEDEARVTVLGGSSESYVRNEDAMYFAPNSDKVSQIYMIDGDGSKIASSVVPSPYDEVKLAYKAVKSGEQTLTVTSVIPGTAVYLLDNETGKETQMNEGSEYSFTSEAGLNSERFVVKTIIDVTGIEESAADASEIIVIASDGEITIKGATAGDTITVYTVSGVQVSSRVAVEGDNVIDMPGEGVLLVKVGDEVFKVKVIK